jgi:protein phosphatase
VQSLIDEGQITEQEAITHPRRSWILRALDGRGTPQLDLAEIDATPGDRLLVCSDGLSSYVNEAAIARVLAGDDPQTAASRLVDLALQAGGSDNISCAVADVADDTLAPREPIVAGAVAEPEPAALHDVAAPTPPAAEERTSHAAPRRRSIGRRLAVVASLVVVLIAAGVVITTVYVHRQWYVAPEAGKVAVFQGVQGNAAGVKLSHRKVLTDIPITALPQDDRERVVHGIQASGGQAGASQVVDNLRLDACAQATTTAAPLTQTASPTPTAATSLSAGKKKGHLPHATHTSPPPTPTWCSTP